MRGSGWTSWQGQIDRILTARSDVPPYEGYDPRYVDGYRGWGQNRYRQYKPEYTEWLSDDGLIISPILAFVELVWDDPSLHAAYKAKADEYLRVVEADVIAKWYANWAPDPGWTDEDNSRYGEDAGVPRVRMVRMETPAAEYVPFVYGRADNASVDFQNRLITNLTRRRSYRSTLNRASR